MKRIMITVAALGMFAGACGGSDDDTGGDAGTADSVESSAEPSAESDDATSEETAEAPESTPTEPESTADEDTGGDDDDDDDGGDSGSSGPIRSIDDIPERCRDQMADFLRSVEPIVSPINWETATFADFETIASEFEALSEEFDLESDSAGCGDLEFVDDNEFELMREFAESTAPGSVGFLVFIDQLGAFAGDDESADGSSGDASGGSGTAPVIGSGFDDCESAIAFVQGLLDDYDSFGEVPASELIQFANLASVYPTCTPDQLMFFDSAEVIDFLGN